MAVVLFKQGEDVVITVAVIKEGEPVDLSQCDNVKAILKINGTEQHKYSTVEESNYGVIVIDEHDTNQAHINVQRAESKDFLIGAVNIILLVAFVDVTFESGFRVEEYKFNVGRCVLGEGKDELIP
jgi:SH3-like domain-containing protein